MHNPTSPSAFSASVRATPRKPAPLCRNPYPSGTRRDRNSATPTTTSKESDSPVNDATQVTALLELQFKVGALDPAREVLNRILAETAQQEGCLELSVIEDSRDPHHIVIVERWRSRDDDKAYRAWRAGDGKIVDLPDLLAHAPQLTRGTRPNWARHDI